MVGPLREFVPMFDRYPAARLLLVEERLDQQGCRKYLVARGIQEIGAGHVRRAYGLAFAAAQAVLDGVGDGADVRLLHDERLLPEQPETRCVGAAQIRTRHELVLVETAAGSDPPFVSAKRREF